MKLAMKLVTMTVLGFAVMTSTAHASRFGAPVVTVPTVTPIRTVVLPPPPRHYTLPVIPPVPFCAYDQRC